MLWPYIENSNRKQKGIFLIIPVIIHINAISTDLVVQIVLIMVVNPVKFTFSKIYFVKFTFSVSSPNNLEECKAFFIKQKSGAGKNSFQAGG